MKRQVQKTGVRKYFGADLVELQGEPLAALDAFFAEYGPCIIQGCEITDNADGTHEVAGGLVALTADDTEGVRRVMVMPFAGVSGVALPLYLTAQGQPVERVYGDGKVKPIAYSYTAQATGVDPGPEVPRLTLSTDGGNRFVDAVQDAGHRFISDAERSRWNRVLEQAKQYADSVAATGSEAALRSANEYTDTCTEAILAEVDTKDTATLRTAKDYTDTTVNALVDGAPETMDTLREVAAELKKHEDTATAMMQVIGEKATMEQVEAALADKLGLANYLGDLNDIRTGLYRLSSGCVNTPYGNGLGSVLLCVEWNTDAARQIYYVYNTPDIYTRIKVAGQWAGWQKLWHSGNFDPAPLFKCLSEIDSSALNDPAIARGGNGVRRVGFYSQYSGMLVSFDPGSCSAGPLQILLDNYQNTSLKWRGGLNSIAADSPFRTIYDSGNLGPATASADGLMSAADKAKLDTIGEGGMKLLGAGFVSGRGELEKKIGAVDRVIRSGGTGYFRVYHTKGHLRYQVQATGYQYGSTNGYVSIRGKGLDYFDVWTSDDDSVNDLSFFFQIYEF